MTYKELILKLNTVDVTRFIMESSTLTDSNFVTTLLKSNVDTNVLTVFVNKIILSKRFKIRMIFENTRVEIDFKTPDSSSPNTYSMDESCVLKLETTIIKSIKESVVSLDLSNTSIDYNDITRQVYTEHDSVIIGGKDLYILLTTPYTTDFIFHLLNLKPVNTIMLVDSDSELNIQDSVKITSYIIKARINEN